MPLEVLRLVERDWDFIMNFLRDAQEARVATYDRVLDSALSNFEKLATDKESALEGRLPPGWGMSDEVRI